MKRMLLACCGLLMSSAFAASLTCVNIYKPTGAPSLRVDVRNKNQLEKVAFNLQDDFFTAYFIEQTGDAGASFNHQPTYTKSTLTNPKDSYSPTVITTGRSPYKGHHQYSMVLGEYSYTSPFLNTKGDYQARLVLPKELTKDALSGARIRDPNEKSNAVLIMPAPYGVAQGGDSYLRLFCESDF